MSYSRPLYLYSTYIKSIFRKIFYDLIRELVVAICSLVLAALFFYMFQDFINVKLAAIDQRMQSSFAKVFSWTLVGLLTVYLNRSFYKWRHLDETLESLSHRLGESPSKVRLFLTLKILTVQSLYSAGLLYILERYVVDFSQQELISFLLIIYLGSSSSFLFPKTQKVPAERSYRNIRFRGRNIVAHLITWRINQIVFRNRMTQVCLLLGLMFSVLGLIGGYSDLPFSISILSALASGYMASAAMIYQVQDDMEHPWIERHCGISHNHMVSCYLVMSIFFAAVFGLLQVVMFSLGSATWSVLIDSNTWKLLAVGATSPLILSAIIFQIDPKRPVVQLIISFIVSLFLGTAIYAHWLSAFLIPVFIYYSLNYQQDAFFKS